MRFKLWLVPLAAFALFGAFAASTSAQDGPPGPSAGTAITTDLIAPRGMVKGPDGMIYIAEAGTGGDTNFTTPDGATVKNGFTGRISKIDPATGARTTVADGLPSQIGPEGDSVGPADVAFIGNTLYYVQTHGGEGYGFPDTPTGIYRVASNGDTDLVVNLGAYNIANPTEAISSGAQPDVEVGGNPYSMITRDGNFYVSDGNHNRLTKSDTSGNVTSVTEFPNHPVSTGIADTASGPFYVGYLGQGPFLPEAGKVVTVAPLTGTITEIASGVPMITDVAVSGANVYALSFANGFAPFTGSIQKVNADGTMSTLVSGLTFATAMMLDGNTLYVTDDGLSALGGGKLVKIENFSAIQPVAATPTAAPTTAPVATPTRSGVTAPDTGTGGFTDDSSGGTALLAGLALAVAAAVATGGAAFAWKRR